MNLSDKKCLVVDDGGLFSPMAELLVKDFSKVGYFVEWESFFADGKDLVVGSGLEGVERVKYLWDVVDEYDLFVFPSVYHGDLQEYLRKQGKRVWGTGKASTLELSRWKTKGLMKQAGLPSKNDRQITGITELRAALKTAKDVFVKISQFRGLRETFRSENEADSKGVVDELEAKYGPILELIPFIIDECIPDAMEIGYDGFCIDGEFPDQSFIGIEIKDKAYFGKLINYDDLPESVRKVNEAFAPHMQGYRQFFSTEIREKDGKGYLIDLTCRHPSPAGEPEIHAMDNLAEVLWFGAEGKLVQPKYSSKFVAQVILCSDWAQNHIQMVEFPDEVRPFVKLYNHAIIQDKDYVINQPYEMKQIGSVIGLGNTPEEAVKMAKGNAEKVTGFDIEREVDALDKAVKELEDAK